jgi:hypothetical protein
MGTQPACRERTRAVDGVVAESACSTWTCATRASWSRLVFVLSFELALAVAGAPGVAFAAAGAGTSFATSHAFSIACAIVSDCELSGIASRTPSADALGTVAAEAWSAELVATDEVAGKDAGIARVGGSAEAAETGAEIAPDALVVPVVAFVAPVAFCAAVEVSLVAPVELMSNCGSGIAFVGAAITEAPFW